MALRGIHLTPLQIPVVGVNQGVRSPKDDTQIFKAHRGPLESAETLLNRRIRVIDKAQGQASYDFLIHNLSTEKKREIGEVTEGVPETEIKDLLKVIQHLNYWELKDPNRYPYVGLAAVKKGLMSEGEFSNLMFYLALEESHPGKVEVVPLFNKWGKPNNLLEDAILQTCHLPRGSAVKREEVGPIATPEQIKHFFEEAKKLPPSQQFIFVTPDHLTAEERCAPTDISLGATLQTKIMQSVRYTASFNFFGQFERQMPGKSIDESYELMGSFGVYQTLGRELYGEDCVAIRPVIGVSSSEEIAEDGRSDQRDIGLPFPGVDLPKRADELVANTAEMFIRHDLSYHFWMASLTPSKHRKAFVAVGDIVKEIAEERELSPLSKEILETFAEKFYDIEFPHYRKNLNAHQRNQNDNFLFSLSLATNLLIGRFYLKSGNYSSLLVASLSIIDHLVKDRLLLRIAERLYDQRDRFKKEFGIELVDPKIFEKQFALSVKISGLPSFYTHLLLEPQNLYEQKLLKVIGESDIPLLISVLDSHKAFNLYFAEEQKI